MRQARIPGVRGGWPAELSEAYAEETGGSLSPGRIGKALSPILKRFEKTKPENDYGYGPLELVKLAFGRWMRSPKRRFGPEYLAREIGEFLGGPGI